MIEVPIRIEVVAAAHDVCWNSITRWCKLGRFPQPDVRMNNRVVGWYLDTLHHHDPALADRVQRVLIALEVQA